MTRHLSQPASGDVVTWHFVFGCMPGCGDKALVYGCKWGCGDEPFALPLTSGYVEKGINRLRRRVPHLLENVVRRHPSVPANQYLIQTLSVYLEILLHPGLRRQGTPSVYACKRGRGDEALAWACKRGSGGKALVDACMLGFSDKELVWGC